MQVHRRFAAWVLWTGKKQTEVAAELGCHKSLITHISRGARKPGRHLASEIERLSAAWPDGPIRVAAWDPPAKIKKTAAKRAA